MTRHEERRQMNYQHISESNSYYCYILLLPHKIKILLNYLLGNIHKSFLIRAQINIYTFKSNFQQNGSHNLEINLRYHFPINDI